MLVSAIDNGESIKCKLIDVDFDHIGDFEALLIPGGRLQTLWKYV